LLVTIIIHGCCFFFLLMPLSSMAVI